MAPIEEILRIRLEQDAQRLQKLLADYLGQDNLLNIPDSVLSSPEYHFGEKLEFSFDSDIGSELVKTRLKLLTLWDAVKMTADKFEALLKVDSGKQ